MTMTNELENLLELFGEWFDFLESIKGLNQETWNSSIEQGKWTIKDIICHIMLWDKYFYEEAINKIVGGEKLTLKHLNYDGFNSKAITYARTITTDELIEEAIYYRERIINGIRTLSKEVVDQEYIDGDGNVFYIPQYLKDFIWHDQHHVHPLKEYLKLD